MWSMLKNYAPHQTELEMVTLEDLVPAEHLVRKIETAIDFEFIRDKVRHLYCGNNGRPAVDPVLLFKRISSNRFLMKLCIKPLSMNWSVAMCSTPTAPT